MSHVTGKDLVTVASIVTAGVVTATAIIVTKADGTVLATFFTFLGGVLAAWASATKRAR